MEITWNTMHSSKLGWTLKTILQAILHSFSEVCVCLKHTVKGTSDSQITCLSFLVSRDCRCMFNYTPPQKSFKNILCFPICIRWMFPSSAPGRLSHVKPSFHLFSDTWILHLGKVPNVRLQNVVSEALLGALMTHTHRPTHTHSECLILSPCGYSDPSHTHNVSDIWRGSVLQQKEDNVQVAHEGSHMYWCEARLRNKATIVLLLCTVGFGGFFR